MDEPLQKSLERYDVLDRIAVGGMAEVFLAKAYGAHGFEKTLAIKRILPELARDPEFSARFIAEAKVAVRLSHANVVQVFDFGRIGETLFIAMEFVDGLDLAALLRRFKDEQRTIPLPAAFHIAIEIVRGLDFAHQHNVVHRDVSPSNILISRAGEVKLGDFGIAVAAAPHKAAGPGARKVMGKWRYMSPEQTRGDTLDTRSDLFSAASVMFELFTGEKLFPGDEAEEIIKNIENMAIPKASAIRKNLPSRLDDILAGPLSRKPIDRPNRPAIVLRSLIELSYESSIMATALDVAEAVSTVLPPKRASGPGQQLDDVIRKELGAARDKSVARRTAVTSNKPPSTATLERKQAEEKGEVSTGLFRKLDQDGMVRLEEAPPGADPLADSGLHRLLEAHGERDRRTEVGGPPTGQVPKVPAPAAEPERVRTQGSTTATLTGGQRRWPAVVAVAGLVGAAAAVAAWAFTRDRGAHAVDAMVARTPADAASQIDTGILLIDPDPEGATGTIVGEDGKPHAFGPTSHAKPVRLRVTAKAKLHVHLELAGYRPLDGDFHVNAGETLAIAPDMQVARAVLHVVTTPPGAQVTLAGKPLGATPLTVDVDAAAGAELALARAGYEPMRLRVDLAAGKTTEVAQTLKASQPTGVIQIQIPMGQGHGEVYVAGKRVGDAPTPALRLPIGRQRLHIVDRDATPPIEWDVECVVDATTVLPCKTHLPQ